MECVHKVLAYPHLVDSLFFLFLFFVAVFFFEK